MGISLMRKLQDLRPFKNLLPGGPLPSHAPCGRSERARARLQSIQSFRGTQGGAGVHLAIALGRPLQLALTGLCQGGARVGVGEWMLRTLNLRGKFTRMKSATSLQLCSHHCFPISALGRGPQGRLERGRDCPQGAQPEKRPG